MKTAFVDLSVAFYTVWEDDLILKLYFYHIFQPLLLYLYLLKWLNLCWQIRENVFSLMIRSLNVDLPQDSVVEHVIFNLYLCDIPTTSSEEFKYAGDIPLAFPHLDLEITGKTLSTDFKIMKNYFNEWCLCSNSIKTKVSGFPSTLSWKIKKIESNIWEYVFES